MWRDWLPLAVLAVCFWVQAGTMTSGFALFARARPVPGIPLLVGGATALGFGAWLVLHPFEWLPPRPEHRRRTCAAAPAGPVMMVRVWWHLWWWLSNSPEAGWSALVALVALAALVVGVAARAVVTRLDDGSPRTRTVATGAAVVGASYLALYLAGFGAVLALFPYIWVLGGLGIGEGALQTVIVWLLAALVVAVVALGLRRRPLWSRSPC